MWQTARREQYGQAGGKTPNGGAGVAVPPHCQANPRAIAMPVNVTWAVRHGK